MGKQVDLKTPKLPAELALTINEITRINVACATIQDANGLTGKASYDLARLTDDSEAIVMRVSKAAKKHADQLKKTVKDEKKVQQRMIEYMEEVGEKTETIRIPALKMSDLIASRDLKLYDIKEGDPLVSVQFLKTMGKYIENDKDF